MTGGYYDNTIRKIEKRPQLVEKRETKKAGFPFVYACGSNTRFKFQVAIRQIERHGKMRFFSLLLVNSTWYLVVGDIS